MDARRLVPRARDVLLVGPAVGDGLPRPVLAADLEDGRIAAYQIVAPTTWNFSPRDAAGVPGPVEAARISADYMWFVTSSTVSALSRLYEKEQRDQLSGVVGSYEVTRQAVDVGAREALTLIALISLSLGIINLFPFLPLDGGHIFWSLVEKVRGRPVPFAVMERAGLIGFALVIGLFILGLNNDIGRLTGEGFNVR